MSDADKPDTSASTQKGAKGQPSATKSGGKGDDRLRRKPPTIEGVGTEITPPPAPSAGETVASEAASAAPASEPTAPTAEAVPTALASETPAAGTQPDAPVAQDVAVEAKPDTPADAAKPEPDPAVAAQVEADKANGAPLTGTSAPDTTERPDAVAAPAPAPAAEPEVTDTRSAMPPTTDRSSPPPPTPAQKPSLLMPAAVAGVVGLLFGGLSGAYMGTAGGPSDAVQAEITRLRESVATLTRQQAGLASAADLQSLGQRLQALDSGLGQRIAALETATRPAGNGASADVQAGIAAATQRLDAAEAAIKALREAPAPAMPDLAPLNQRLDGLDRSLGQVSEKLSGIASAQQNLTGRVDANEQRLGRIEPGLAGVGDQVKAAAAKADEISAGLAAAGTRLTDLTARLDRVNREISGIKLGPTLTATQSLLAAAEKGGPFQRELAGLEALGADPGAIAKLKPFADRGAPTARRLSDALAPRMALIARHGVPPPPAAPSSVGEWLQGAANALVTSRPVGDAEGNAPAAVAARVEAHLRRGNADAAVAEWQRMPEDVRALAPDFTALAAERVTFSEAIAAIERQALAAARQP